MKPVITVEFHAKEGAIDFEEESVSLHGTDELLEFVAPGSGCDKIPDEVGEIRMVFMPAKHKNANNPVADTPATLQLGIVVFYGPLSEIANAATQILDKAGSGGLSSSFLTVLGSAD